MGFCRGFSKQATSVIRFYAQGLGASEYISGSQVQAPG